MTILTLRIMAVALSLLLGVAVALLARAAVLIHDVKTAAQMKIEALDIANSTSYARGGVIAALDGEQLILRTLAPQSDDSIEHFLMRITPETAIMRKDPVVKDGIVTGFGVMRPGERETLRVGLRVHVTFIAVNEGFVAERILYGDPFPVP